MRLVEQDAFQLLTVMLLLLLACCGAMAGSPDRGAGDGDGGGGSKQCQTLSDSYFSSMHHREPAPYTGRNLAFFLHIPRTAGRTFHDCFLRMGTPPQRLCPNAWDPTLGHLNFSDPQCFLLSSHDDYSIISMLPEGTSVLTHTRDPVDRFISAYEFAIQVREELHSCIQHPATPHPHVVSRHCLPPPL